MCVCVGVSVSVRECVRCVGIPRCTYHYASGGIAEKLTVCVSETDQQMHIDYN